MTIPTPTALWKMNNNYTDTMGSYSFTSGNAAYSTDRINGSNSFSLNGTNQYVTRTGSPWTSTSTSLTVAFWAKPTGYGWAGCGINMGGGGTVTGNTVRFGLDNGRALAITRVGFVSFRWSGVLGITNAWNFYCIVYKGTWDTSTPANTAHCFKNKTKYTNTNVTGSGAPSPHNSISIGRVYIDWSTALNYSGSGLMDDIYVYASQLTDAQVIDLYNFTAPKYLSTSYA